MTSVWCFAQRWISILIVKRFDDCKEWSCLICSGFCYWWEKSTDASSKTIKFFKQIKFNVRNFKMYFSVRFIIFNVLFEYIRMHRQKWAINVKNQHCRSISFNTQIYWKYKPWQVWTYKSWTKICSIAILINAHTFFHIVQCHGKSI